MKKIVFLALAGIAASAAVAETSTRRDPLDSWEQVPAARYHSAFEGYQSYRDPLAVKWRDANDKVKTFGGHAGHLVRPDSFGSSRPGNDAVRAGEAIRSGHEGHHR
jgi:hypothetical protein